MGNINYRTLSFKILQNEHTYTQYVNYETNETMKKL